MRRRARSGTADGERKRGTNEWDEQHIVPREPIKAAAELGFASIYVSEESGGIGLGRLEAALIMEAMAYGCASTSACHSSAFFTGFLSAVFQPFFCQPKIHLVMPSMT